MLSVVICTYNEASCIRGMLESLIECADSRINEIFVIDDNSTDSTQAEVKAVQDKRIIFCEKPITSMKGKNSSILLGASLAKNENLILIDADTRVKSISEMVDKLENGADLVGGLVGIKDNGKLLSMCESIEYDVAIRRVRPWLHKRGYINNVSGAFFGIKRNLLLDNPVPTGLMGEDMYLTQIGLIKGWNIQLCESKIVTLPIPNVKSLLIQRARWTYGWAQVIKATGRKTPLIEAVPILYRTFAISFAILCDIQSFSTAALIALLLYFSYEYYRTESVLNALCMMCYRQLNFISAILSPWLGKSWTVRR